MSYFIEPRNFSFKHEHRLPVNFKPEYEHLFRPDYKYLDVKLGVRSLENVFVNHYGLVLKNFLLVKGCAPNIGFSSYDDRFYYEHWRKAIEQLLVCKFGKSIPSIKLDPNKKYLLIHSPWFSYYFWITECLPRLLMVKDYLDELTLIYPESWKQFSFINETLLLFPKLKIEVVPADHQMFIKHLVMPEVKPWTPMFIPEQSLEVRKLILDEAFKRNVSVPSIKNLYLSRKDSKRKNFENETEVLNLLKKYGFEAVTFSGLSIFEQALLVHRAKNIVSITGAGMSNFTFLSEGTNVLDVTNEKYIHHKKYKFHYWKLTTIMRSNYFVQFCPHTNHPDVPRFSLQNLIPNLEEMEQIVHEMINYQ